MLQYPESQVAHNFCIASVHENYAYTKNSTPQSVSQSKLENAAGKECDALVNNTVVLVSSLLTTAIPILSLNSSLTAKLIQSVLQWLAKNHKTAYETPLVTRPKKRREDYWACRL